MRVFVLSIGALLTFGLLIVASHIAWRQILRLARESRSDNWASEVPPWH